MKLLSTDNHYWYVILAAVLYGSITAGGQFFVNLGLSLFEISIYRAFFTSLILLPVVFIKREYLIKKEMLSFFAIYGLIGGLLELATFGGIALGVHVAIVTLLLYTQPIWTIMFGRLLLREGITTTRLIAVVIALFGIILLVKPWGIENVESLTGIVVSLASGVLLSLWVIWGRKSVIQKQHIVTTTIGWTGFSVIWLLLLWPIFYYFFPYAVITGIRVNLPMAFLLFLVIYALIGGVIPHLLFYRGFKKIEASVAGILLLLEPISASVLAALFFGQPIGLDVMIGGALILVSNYFVIRERGNITLTV
jgi:drug/metabolite transporter, DME family